MSSLVAHSLILLTLLLGLYGQVVLKWQVSRAGVPPEDWAGRIGYVLHLLVNPWVVTSVLAAFLGMVAWMLALARVELSYAYPFTSLSFVLILVASAFVFHEPVTAQKLVGMALIIAGIAIGSRG
ncbi:MAG TPA: EamA family transporter [Burkholderiales bacterium]|nr:EamA family transporter [Burkholderiales bacterium]